MNSNGHRRALHFDRPPSRVVSLVPSMTESLFDLGLGAAVVGITDYCVHPAGKLRGLARIGGPKNPQIDAIVALQPDLVIANQEENTPKAVHALEEAGLQVWVSFPQTVHQALETLWALVGVYQDRQAAARLETLQQPVGWMESARAEQPGLSVFCPIWEDQTDSGERWWMTFNQHTYAHDVLRLAGGENVFAERARRYPLEADLGHAEPADPGERDTRYPRITLAEIRRAQPEIILLPSEPFAFNEAHRQALIGRLSDVPAVHNNRVHLVDGSLITWHGTRLARAIRDLPAFFPFQT